MKISGNAILITGAGSGIGRALAQKWAAAGNDIIASDYNAESLAQTCAGYDNITPIVADMADMGQVQALANAALARHDNINVVVNNAGIMGFEDLTARLDMGRAQQVFATNFFGPVALVDAMMGHLLEVGDAVVINVTSGLAYVPLPSAPIYSASKAALLAYNIALRAQLKGRVEVVNVVPPGVRTNLTPDHPSAEGYLGLDEYVDAVLVQLAQSPTPQEVIVPEVRLFTDAAAEGRIDEVLALMGG